MRFCAAGDVERQMAAAAVMDMSDTKETLHLADALEVTKRKVE